MKVNKSFYVISDNRNAAQHIKSIFENCVVLSDFNSDRIENGVIFIDHDKLNKSFVESILNKHNDIFIIQDKIYIIIVKGFKCDIAKLTITSVI